MSIFSTTYQFALKRFRSSASPNQRCSAYNTENKVDYSLEFMHLATYFYIRVSYIQIEFYSLTEVQKE